MVESVFFNVPLSRLEPIFKEWVRDVMQSESQSNSLSRPPANRREAAEYLGVSLPTLDNLEKSGRLKGFFIGRQKRYRWEAIEAIADNKERSADHV